MPWIERPTAALTFALVDETGSRANLSLDVPQTTAADVALIAAAALRPLIQAITDCAVLSYSLTYSCASCPRRASPIRVEIRQQPYMRLVVADASDSRASNQLHVRANTPHSTALAAAYQLADLVRGVTGCAPLSVDLRYPVVDSTPPSAMPGSLSLRQALFVFDTDTIEQFAIVRVPGISPNYIIGVEPYYIDIANPAIVALTDAIINGLWCNRFGYNLTRCIAGIVSQV